MPGILRGGHWTRSLAVAIGTTMPGRAVFDEATAQEAPQSALDHSTERAVHSREPRLVHAEELLEVPLDRTEQR
jgi:hypothetical protein